MSGRSKNHNMHVHAVDHCIYSKAQTTSPSYAHSSKCSVKYVNFINIDVYNDQSLVNIASYYNEEINKLKSKFVDKIVSSSDYRITGELGEGIIITK